MVIDHSVIADLFGTENALERNVEIEYERNGERYQFLRWGQTAFDDFKVVPPGTGIVHQVNIEHLAKVIYDRTVDGVLRAYPDTCVGTDSHTTMVNGLGVLGWGVGGIEAEAAMLGQPVSMLIPKVVGFKLSGEIPTGVTATDVVLTITDMLRKHGVVGKFVEFYGAGVASVPLANRATIGNMSPEFGSTAAMFPIDDVTLDYLRLTGRSDEPVALVEAYSKLQTLWHDAAKEPVFSEYLELDLGTVVPSIAGPKRPQDRILLSNAKTQFASDLTNYADVEHDLVDLEGSESFPASDPPGNSPDDQTWTEIGSGFPLTGLTSANIGVAAYNGTGSETGTFEAFTVGEPPDLPPTPPCETPNTPEAGYTMPFDGTDSSLEDWSYAGGGRFVREGCTIKSVGAFGLLYTKQDFEAPYSLKLEWMMPGDDELRRLRRLPGYGGEHGPDVDLAGRGDPDRPDGQPGPDHRRDLPRAGGGRRRPRRGPQAGWSVERVELVVRKDRIVVYLNGVKINEWLEDDPNVDLATGHIGLQTHGSGDDVYFRNIRVRDLEQSVGVDTTISGAVPATLSLTWALGFVRTFLPNVARTYETTMAATVTSTAEDAA